MEASCSPLTRGRHYIPGWGGHNCIGQAADQKKQYSHKNYGFGVLVSGVQDLKNQRLHHLAALSCADFKLRDVETEILIFMAISSVLLREVCMLKLSYMVFVPSISQYSTATNLSKFCNTAQQQTYH